jgi:hypothetical protein
LNDKVEAVDLGFLIPSIVITIVPPANEVLVNPPDIFRVSLEVNSQVIADGNPLTLAQELALLVVSAIVMALGNTISM